MSIARKHHGPFLPLSSLSCLYKCQGLKKKKGSIKPPPMDWFSWLSRTGLDPLHTYEYGLLFARNGLKPHDIPTFNHPFLHKIGIPIAKHRLEILKLAKQHQQKPSHTKSLLSAITRTKHRLTNCLKNLVLFNYPKPDHRLFRLRSDPAEISPEPPIYIEDVKIPPPPPRRRSKNVSYSGPLDGREMTVRKSLKLSGPLERKERPRSPRYSGPLERKERPVFPRSPQHSGPLEGRVSDWALSKSPTYSGPLEGRVSDWALIKSPKVNGPLQGRMMRLIPPSRSPRVSGPLDGRDGSPRVCCHCTDDDYRSLWVSMFYDMKPT